jgi:hypothetical protein
MEWEHTPEPTMQPPSVNGSENRNGNMSHDVDEENSMLDMYPESVLEMYPASIDEYHAKYPYWARTPARSTVNEQINIDGRNNADGHNGRNGHNNVDRGSNAVLRSDVGRHSSTAGRNNAVGRNNAGGGTAVGPSFNIGPGGNVDGRNNVDEQNDGKPENDMKINTENGLIFMGPGWAVTSRPQDFPRIIPAIVRERMHALPAPETPRTLRQVLMSLGTAGDNRHSQTPEHGPNEDSQISAASGGATPSDHEEIRPLEGKSAPLKRRASEDALVSDVQSFKSARVK